jgi:predicted PurR-regulated permease PerM
MAWITYDSIWYPLGIVGIFVFVQYLEANVIFPVAVSSRLNVNTLVMLIATFAGGIVWGLAGMILFVPFVGISQAHSRSQSKMEDSLDDPWNGQSYVNRLILMLM